MDRWDNREKADDLNNDGVDLFDQGCFEDAIKCFDEAIRLNPKDELLWYHKGLSLHYLENYVESVKCFDEAISLEGGLDKSE
jgi:tetratricopeptide (TPR) repeat protein